MTQRTRNIFLSSVLLFSMLTALSAQTTQKGRITEMSSGSSPVAGCEITAAGAAPSDSDGEGRFQLVFASSFPGDPLIGLSIYKKGYMIVNQEKLQSWNLTESSDLCVVLGKREIIDSLKRKYYDIGITRSELNYRKAMDQLNALQMEQKVSEEEYRHKVDSLNVQLRNYEKKLNTYTGRFARINRDEMDEMEAMALDLIDKGDLEGAIRIYESMELEKKLSSRITVRNETQEDLEKLLPSLINNFQLLKSQNNLSKCDSLASIIDKAAQKTEHKIIQAEWLVYKGDIEKAIGTYARLISESMSEEDLSIIEQSISGTGITEASLATRIEKRRNFFKLKENIR